MNTTNLALWFLQWWDYFGCHVDYLKEHPLVENGYLHFKNNFQPTPSKRNILWLKMVTSISKIIFNQPLLKGNFLPFSFAGQSFLFYGYVHGSMITISKTDIQYLSTNSKSNGGIPL
jgi:hypothetical protein